MSWVTGSVLASRIAVPVDLHEGVPNVPLVCEMLYATVFDPGVVAAALSIDDKDVRSVYAGGQSTSATAGMKNIEVEDIPEVVREPLEQAPLRLLRRLQQRHLWLKKLHRRSLKSGVTKQVFKDNSDQTSKTGGETANVNVRKNDTIRLNVERIDRLMALAGELVLVRNRAMMMLKRPVGKVVKCSSSSIL